MVKRGWIQCSREQAIVSQTDRLVAIDIARSVAMLLALTAHAGFQTSLDLPVAVTLVLRVATPLFIVLFGAMVTLVYIPRRERSGLSQTAVTCWSRSLQCCLFFWLNILALGFMDSFSFPYLILCLLMLDTSPFVGILKYYAIMFFLLPGIIELIRKTGTRVLLAVALAYHALYPLLKAFPDPPEFSHQTILLRIDLLLFGTGTQTMIAGPSILHSLALFFGGCWLGEWIRRTREQGMMDSMWPIVPLIGSFCLLILYSIFVSGPGQLTAVALGNMHLRNLNHPAYVGIYGLVAIAGVAVLYRLSNFYRLPTSLLFLSRRPQFAFGFGNFLIVLWPRGLSKVIGATTNCGLLLGCVIALVFGYDSLMRSDAKRGVAARLVHDVTQVITSATLSVAAVFWHIGLSAQRQPIDR
jgi:hypothetical protein